MDFQPLRMRFTQLRHALDLQGTRKLLTDNPGFLKDPKCRADMMIDAAMYCDSPRLVAFLNEMGIDVNIAVPGKPLNRPIEVAANVSHWGTVRWLVEHGAELNYETAEREPVCYPLNCAIRAGQLDIVKILVEYGAFLDVCDRRHLTPLAWAVNYGQTEIADYLRSKGAVMPEQARNFHSKSALQVFLNDNFSEPQKLDWPPAHAHDPLIVTHCVLNVAFQAAITEGMSSRPMNVPAGYERYRFAELAMPLSASYWPEWPDAPQAWLQEQYVWAIEWLHRLTRYPFERNTWLGEKLADPAPIIPNGEPPQPLSPYTKMTCWLLLPEMKLDVHQTTGAKLRDGADVVFYTVMAIHTAERDFVRKQGLEALLWKFEEQNVDVQLDPNRESVV